jgi:hypothetical protein
VKKEKRKKGWRRVLDQMELMAVAQQTPLSITNVVVKTPFHCQFCIQNKKKGGQYIVSHIALFHICSHKAQSKERIDVYSASILAI